MKHNSLGAETTDYPKWIKEHIGTEEHLKNSASNQIIQERVYDTVS